MNDTLDWYAAHAATFATAADTVDLTALHTAFVARLPAGARVLDVGCGSGRDSRAFVAMGCRVTALEPCEALARIAESSLGFPVRRARVEELDERGVYDGVWACASLLHVPVASTPEVLSRLARALAPGGVLYVSYKRGSGERVEGGRFFHDETMASLGLRLGAAGFATVTCWETPDARPEQSHTVWVNALASVERCFARGVG